MTGDKRTQSEQVRGTRLRARVRDDPERFRGRVGRLVKHKPVGPKGS